MKCPACGATLKKISRECNECGALLKKNSDGSLAQITEAAESIAPLAVKPAAVFTKPAEVSRPTPSLIAFPGVNRNALPEWRKELSERVREKQERRAREAQLGNNGTATATLEATEHQNTPMLELLPQAEAQPVNPILQAALQRIERAHSHSHAHAGVAVATAALREEERNFAGPDELDAESELAVEGVEELPEARPVEKTHNLAVVPNPKPVEETTEPVRKPKRLIADSNDPALNYLDAIPTALLVERRDFIPAGTTRRMVAAIVDLSIVFILSLPLLMLDPVTTFDLQNSRALAFSAGSFVLVGFLYLTVVTALTGRTLGMRLCSLRVVDARNGLIPTGSQSAGRALIYLLSLASAGLLSLYLFIDSERQTLHDRFTHTAVIRA